MKTSLLTLAVLFYSTHSLAAENPLVKKLVSYAQSGATFELTKGNGSCDKKLALRETAVPQSQSELSLQFGSITLRADSSQEDAVMTETVDGVELTYRQSSGPEILGLSHYLPRVRNQLVKFYSVEKAITVEAIEYNYDSTPVYMYCVYYLTK